MATKSKQQDGGTPSGSNGHAPLRAVLYARVSTEEQKERQSIQTQIEFARHYCERAGIPLGAIYTDEGVSGTIPFEDRAGGRRLLADARAKKFTVVWVYKVDRLGRADLVTHVARHHLETLGVGIRSLTEPFDTATPHGRFMFGIFASFAQLERDSIRERSMAGMSRVVKNGKWSGGITPYGYRVDANGQLRASEELLPGMTISEVEVIRLIFRWATERASTITIARRLTDMGVPLRDSIDGRTRKRGNLTVSPGGQWASARISYLLHTTTYMGQHVYGKRAKDQNRERITRPVVALVSEAVWWQAQEALRLNALGAKRNSKREYLLRGLVRCGFCGRSMSGITTLGKRFYYRCNATLKHIALASLPCVARHVPSDWLDTLVWDELKDWVLHHTNLEAIVTEALHEQDRQRQEWRATHTRLRAEIRLKDEERERIITAYRKGVLSSGDLERQLTGMEKEKQVLEHAANDLEQRYDLHLDLEEAIATIRQQLGKFRASIQKGTVPYQEKRRIVEAFVKEIRVYLKKGSNVAAVRVKETVPFRPHLGEDTSHNGERLMVWQRQNGESLPDGGEEGTLRITYRFPFPPKPRQLVGIDPHTDCPA